MGGQRKVWEKHCILYEAGRGENRRVDKSPFPFFPRNTASFPTNSSSEELKETSVKHSSSEKEISSVDSIDLDRSCFILILFPLRVWLELQVEPIQSKTISSGFICNIPY